MVFESIVADLLNRFLGDYVENLDRSQLQIGIFGGDVVLQDLILKQSALDELDLPVRTVYGHLGKLVLKIPWRNLYSAPVIASIERLFLLVVPNQEIKYDAEKEEKWKQEAKQAELHRIEEAKKLEKEKNKEKLPSTFAEKLAAQIIKNVQVYIHDIHIRYEDRYTSPQRPFSVGITLHNLSVHSTDDKWKECIVQDDSPMFYKVLVLECLAVYWNCKTRSFPDNAGDHKVLLKEFQDSICTKGKAPKDFTYMLGPINSSAKLRINPKPEQDGSNFSIPKILLDFALEKLSVGISKEQYRDVIELLESMDRMNRAAQYRKYRPHLSSYHGNYKQWWKFAYTCVVEEDVRRRRRNWNWQHMKEHRRLCREYAEVYQLKLTKGAKLPAEQKALLARCEEQLDLTNIVIIRQRVEVEAERILAAKQQAQKQQSWFNLHSWWGSGSKQEEDRLTAVAIAKKFEDAMTADEKAKLYRAIDYQENAAPPQYPPEFVELSAQFTLGSLQVEVRDDAYTTPRVMLADLARVSVSLKRRPATQALRVDVAVGQFTVFGLAGGEQRPQLISSPKLAGGKVDLLDVLFETNPLDGRCDQRIHVSSRPLQVVYDASTINKLADVFRPPAESKAISQLQAAAGSRLAELKEMSATGLQYAIEQHTVLDLSVDLMASFVLIPYGGVYTGHEDMLVVDLGSFKMSSITRDPKTKQTVREMHSQGTGEEEIMQAILSQSYDKFKIELQDVQILVALAGEPWKNVIEKHEKNSAMHLLHPTTLLVHLDKCLITDDPRLPKLKIGAQLPSVSLNVTDMRILRLMAIFASIPFPTEEEIPAPIQETGSRSSSTSAVAKYLEFEGRKSRTREDSKLPAEELVQAIDMEIKFVMKEFVMAMYNQLNITEAEHDTGANGDSAQKLFDFRMLHLEFEMVEQTFDKTIMLRLGGLAFDLNDPVSGSVRLLDTPMAAGELEYLLTVKYTNVDRSSPELHTRHGSVLQLVAIDFTRLTVVLHQEGLAAFLDYAQRLQAELEQTQVTAARASGRLPSRPADAGKLETIAEDEEVKPVTQPRPSAARRSRKTTLVIETIDFKLTASMHNLEVCVTSRKRQLASAALLGVDATMAIKKSYKEISAHLRNITVSDPNPESSHSQILSVVGEEALSAHVVIFDLDEAADTSDKVDMSVNVSMACVKVVFLNWFVTTMLNFLSSFQQAQQSIIDAAHDAAEAAKQNVQQAYTKAVRIALDIDLQAPIVIVPTNSKSSDAIMLDFGKLTIKNKFHNIAAEDKSGHVAVIDDIRLGLVDLKVARVALDIAMNKIVRECVLLQPISLVLAVKRNLSTSWYKNVPDLEIQGRLETVQVTLSQEDYSMVMRVLTGNLAEGQPAKPATSAASTTDTKVPTMDWESGVPKTDQRPTTLNVPQVYQAPSPTETQAEPATAAVTTSLKFTFTMENLIIDLFTGGLKALDGPHSPLRSDNAGLARFTLHVLSLKGHIRSDGCLAVSALLVDCMLDDTRFGREKALTRLMQRKRGAAADASPKKSRSPVRGSPPTEGGFRSMLDLTYQQKDGDSFVDVRVFGFDLVLCLDYLMKVADFFTSGMAQAQAEVAAAAVTAAEGPPAAAAPSRTSRMSVKQSRTSNSLTAVAAPTPSQQPQTTPAKSGMMTINLHVEMPDIILVESMDTVDTNALIMNNEISFKLRMSDTHLVITGGIKDLQLYSCCYSPDKRKDTMQQILRPCSITLAGSTPDGEGLHLDLTVTDVRLGVSPATIELLTKVQAALTASATKQDESEEAEVDYSDLWTPKPFKDTDHWFLITEEGEDAVAALTGEAPSAPSLPQEKPVKNEICVISAPNVVITVEAGIGTRTLPMILLEMGFQGEARNWSSQLYVDSNLSVQMAYYNSYLALWEPLIEPVEVIKDGKPSHALWELRAEVSMNPAEPVQSPASTEDVEEIPFQPPAMTIDITSKDNLELTVSKTCLEVFSNLGKAFQSAVSGQLPPRQEQTPPFMVRNDTGLTVTLMLEEGPFQVVGQPGPEGYRQAMLESGAVACLCLQSGEEPTTLSGKLCLVPVGSATVTPDRQGGAPSARDRMLTVKVRVLDKDCILKLPVVRADKRYFPLNHRGESNDPWGIVSEVTVDDSSTIVTLRSIIQVYNHFSEPVDVYYMTRRGNEVERVGTVQAGRPLNLPLYAVYTPTNELFFSVKGYTVSVIPFVWKELQNMLTHSKMLQCEPKDKKDKDPFFMKIVGELEQVYFEQTSRHTVASSCYNIYLRPAVMLKNLLPVDIVCCLAGTAKETQLKPGHRAQVATAEPGSSIIIIRIPDYLEKEWMCKHDVQANPPPFSVWTFDSYDSVQKVSMDLGIHTVHKNGSLIMSVYCPFWMLNKTGMMLSYRKSRKTEKNESSGSPLKQSDETTNVLYHPDDFKGPILFSFRAKSFFGKKKASVKVEDGEWSDKFSLDVAGSSGIVNCKYGDTVYQIGVHIQLTYSGLTKQVTFTPYFVLINETKFLVECQEAERTADPWTKVKPGECSALWPRSPNNGDRKLRLRVPEQSGMTAPFSIATVHTTLLRLNNKFGGVNVDVQITEGAAYVKFTPYEPGMAPALIINQTSEPIKFTEKGCKESRTVKPHEQVMFTWEDPAGPRELQWTSPKKKEISVDLRKDTIDRMQVADGSELWWVSFLDGLQRILLFTEDMAIATACQAAGELEPFDREIKVSVHGVGLSLVNNVARTEVMYLGIASSGIIWETCKLNSRRFKPLSVREGAALELAYQCYLQELAVGQEAAAAHHVLVDGKLEVDFKAEEVLRPNRRKLRRTYHTGLWLQLRTSPHQSQLHAKINRLQIDNQMFDCMFPVVLAPVPPPKSVAADNVLKPFAEVSIVQRIMEHSPVQQFKYFKVLIQEFHIKLDMGFVNGLVQLFMADEISDAQEAEQFAADLKVVEEPLQSHVSMQSSQEQKNFYDLLHFSPLKVHLSFSLSGGDSGSNQQTQTPLFLNVLLQSLGVTLTDMQDVVFKLAYFERQYTFLTQRQLVSEATSHYVGQTLKQLYVLVLGLDVLGNPYGLVVGLTQGVEDLFYEPFQGAIQGPGEFAEGLVLGVRSLFGHTVGGAAGAVSRITGAMGKGIAALTFDKEYQRKRREAMHQRAPNVQTGLAQSGKGLVMGVVDGVTGVFTKPISGAREEGVEGFFKGVGKGMVGLVTRPTAGVIDFASGSLDAVKRATEVGDEVLRLRPPRYFRADGLLRPYMREEAEGNKLLQEVDKNKYASTDTYVAHMAIGKDVVLLTDKRIMYIVHNDIFGGWQVEWGYTWDIIADPRLVEKGIFISTGESRKKVLGLFGSGESGKVLLIKEPERRQWLLNKMEEMIRK